MSEQKHSAEPWRVDRFGDGIEDSERDGIGCFNGGFSDTQDEANASRSVLCVNYCTGMPPEKLEGKFARSLLIQIEHLESGLNANAEEIKRLQTELAKQKTTQSKGHELWLKALTDLEAMKAPVERLKKVEAFMKERFTPRDFDAQTWEELGL